MRVLHLTPELPYWPGGAGGSTRQYHLLRRLVELGHEVQVVAPTTHADGGGAARLAAAGVQLRPYERPAWRLVEGARAVAHAPALAWEAVRLPVLAWQVSVFWTGMRPRAAELMRSWHPDVVTVDHDSAAHWIHDLPREVPAVLTFHNVSWAYYESRARVATGWRRHLYRLEAGRFRRHDLVCLERYDTLVAMSENEAVALRAATDTPVEVIPNGVSTSELQPGPEPDGPPTLLFTGTMNHPPNAEGITWFADRVWPRIRRSIPDVQLLVVGRHPPQEVQDLGLREGIVVTGAVPDIAPFFARSLAVVAPLLSGGGTRLKILEAFAAGRALVATPIAAEGLDVQPDRELLVEEQPEPFADACVQLLRDPGLRTRLAGAGRLAAESRYDWRALGERLASVLQAAAR